MKMLARFAAMAAMVALSACSTTSDSESKAASAPAARPATIQEQVASVKSACEKASATRGQWYQCWVPQAERIHEQMGYPHMDLLKVHTSEMMMIARSMNQGTFTPEQGEAMVAQSMLRFNNGVAERESKSRERDMESWRQFRQYIQNPY